MAIREVPISYEYTCDSCGTNVARSTKGRPPHWSELTMAQDAYDYQGAAVADGTIKRLLCDRCTPLVTAAINAALTKDTPNANG